jgi:HrpA-like RNA helicase
MCRRVCNGFCVRLYTRAFFESLPEHEDPEMAIRPLDSVLLQVSAACAHAASGRCSLTHSLHLGVIPCPHR